MKICNLCNESKLITEFRVNRRKCNDCERKRCREYRQSERGKLKSKEWNMNNSKRMAQLQANWYQNNKPKVRQKFVDRYHSDYEFKFKHLIKSRCLHGLQKYKKDGISKSDRTIKYLGCSMKEFIEWLEYRLEESKDFNFSNHGDLWHLDHVIPIATFDLSIQDNHFIAFNWRNIMPYAGKENMHKKDKIDTDQISQHLIMLNKYHDINNIDFPITFNNLYAKHLMDRDWETIK